MSKTETVHNEAHYDKLKEHGVSAEKAERISNERYGDRLGGKATYLEDRSLENLQSRAQRIGIDGLEDMSKSELISAIKEK